MIVNTEFSEAVVESLHDVTPTVRELRIRPIAHKPVPHDPGAHLQVQILVAGCLLYTSPSPRDVEESRMPSSA